MGNIERIDPYIQTQLTDFEAFFAYFGYTMVKNN